MSRSSRRRRDRKQDQRRKVETAKALQQLADDVVAAMAKDGMKPGMTTAQALDLAAVSRDKIAQRFSEVGGVSRAPWGELAYDPRMLMATIRAALLSLSTGDDETRNQRDLSEEESFQTSLQLVSGAITMSGACLLYLQSLPIPYEMARALVVREIPQDREDD